MLYHKVCIGDLYDYTTGYTTVKDELLTTRERNKKFPIISDLAFTDVQVSKRRIYWFFGCRFES